MDGKYIIKEIKGLEVAILFDALINHCDIGTCKESRGKTVSAGFFYASEYAHASDVEDVDVEVFGRSESLNMDSRPVDAEIIKRVIRNR